MSDWRLRSFVDDSGFDFCMKGQSGKSRNIKMTNRVLIRQGHSDNIAITTSFVAFELCPLTLFKVLGSTVSLRAREERDHVTHTSGPGTVTSSRIWLRVVI
jgi:hypothetical protein